MARIFTAVELGLPRLPLDHVSHDDRIRKASQCCESFYSLTMAGSYFYTIYLPFGRYYPSTTIHTFAPQSRVYSVTLLDIV